MFRKHLGSVSLVFLISLLRRQHFYGFLWNAHLHGAEHVILKPYESGHIADAQLFRFLKFCPL